jgi:hypothetical protein
VAGHTGRPFQRHRSEAGHTGRPFQRHRSEDIHLICHRVETKKLLFGQIQTLMVGKTHRPEEKYVFVVLEEKQQTEL